jgi:hypothetical protein
MATHPLGQADGQALHSDTGKIGGVGTYSSYLAENELEKAEPTAGTQLAKTCRKERNDYENAKFTETRIVYVVSFGSVVESAG